MWSGEKTEASLSMVEEPNKFYDSYGRQEWERLETGIDGALEFNETVKALEAHLPDSGRVLDAGGGSGRYSVWLAEHGYEVVLLDISSRQVEIAVEMARGYGVESNIDVVRGSITDISAKSNAFDATCCLGGPLSHVLDEQERSRAASELRRVTAPDGPVFASVMGRLGAVQLYLLSGNYVKALPELAEHGDYTAELLAKHGYEMDFAPTHFFRREEFERLLSDAGLEVVEVVGLEGLASPFHDEGIRAVTSELTGEEMSALEQAVSETNADAAVTDLSIHMLAICQS